MEQNISQTCRGCLSDVGDEAYSLLSEEIRNLYGSCTKISVRTKIIFICLSGLPDPILMTSPIQL